ncbi:hypothetical protein JCM8115_005843 [Rhodotorula mucilaginosa]
MICRRRNLGTLKVGYAPPTPQGVALGAIELVPIEVWQLIKQHLTASTARDALQAFLHPIRDFCVRDSQSPHPPTESLAECESCLFDFRNDHDMHDHILPAYGDIDRMLAEFGLKRVDIQLVGGDNNWVGFDLDAACAIAISRHPSRQERASHEHDERCRVEFAQVGRGVSLDRDHFELPAAADTIFLRLFEHFPSLQVVNHPLWTQPSQSLPPRFMTQPTSAIGILAQQLGGVEVAGHYQARPEWMLCSDYERCC